MLESSTPPELPSHGQGIVKSPVPNKRLDLAMLYVDFIITYLCHDFYQKTDKIII